MRLNEADLIPFAAGELPGRRWLVLAPHPDDEVLGPGATLAAAAARGVEVRVVCVTSGGAQGEAGEREREAALAAHELGLRPPELWRLPDRGVNERRTELCRRLEAALDHPQPDLVLVPSPVELHPDHRAVAGAVQDLLRRRLLWGFRRREPTWVAAYEVSVPILPNLLVAADVTWERKRRAMATYRSQLVFRAYTAMMEGVGVIRALTLPTGERAEAFHLLLARDLARHSRRWWVTRMGAARVLGKGTLRSPGRPSE